MTAPTKEQLQRMGQSLREIDPATLHPDPAEGPVRWFLGEGATEITAWTNDAGIPHHMQLVFARVSVEWSERGLFTGQFENKSSTAGGRYDPYLLHVGSAADPAVCDAALTLLDASDVDPAVREPLREALRRALSHKPEGKAADGQP